jgi:hypothetical protein
MAKLPRPPPPAVLRRIAPIWLHVHAGSLLWRIYFRGGAHPGVWNGFRDFGPLRSARFDHHLPPPRVQDRRILYCATEIQTCLAEVFQEGGHVDRAFREPWLVGFESTRDLQLLDLSGVWPTRAGASMNVNSGPRTRARAWSACIHEAYTAAEGLWYASSMHANRPAVALYDRAKSALPAHPLVHRALADPTLLVSLQRAAAELGYVLT